jgi:hypothetical protein
MSKMKDLTICAVSISSDRDQRRAIKPGILADIVGEDDDDTPEMLPVAYQPIIVARVWTDGYDVTVPERDRVGSVKLVRVEQPSKLWNTFEAEAEPEGDCDVAYISKHAYRDGSCCDKANSTENHKKAVEAIMMRLAADYHAALVFDHVTGYEYYLSLRIAMRIQLRCLYVIPPTAKKARRYSAV